MKVTLICHSDMIGGAAVVTRRLMNALRREGVDARMLVFTRMTPDPNVHNISSRSRRSYTFIRERARIFMNNGFSRDRLFKVSLADVGIDISRHPLVKDADVIMLSWVNQGMLSLKGVKALTSLGKPVVWLMHDMWNLTGICHHAYECDRYKEACGCCPYLASHNPRDLSHSVWERKKKLYADTSITFVAVSRWLAGKCAESSLMRDQRVEVIPNAFPIDDFSVKPQSRLKISQLDYSKRILLMGAARLDDPIKGLDYTIDALNEIFRDNPALAEECMMVFFGDIKDRAKLDRLNFPFRHIGVITDTNVLHELYAAASVVISTSLYETLPGTLIEGQASGALPVTFGQGGQADIVDHLNSGYIARYKDAHSIAEGIEWALTEATVDPQRLHEQVGQRFSSESVARRFITLFDNLLAADGL